VGLGARAPAGLFEALAARYAEPHRAYHTLQHLQECFAALDPVAGEAEHLAEVRLALWFHDAIYDTHAHDNEEASARWASDSLAEGGADRAAAERVRALILATKHDALPAAGDAQLLVDIDLSILGASDARFVEYEELGSLRVLVGPGGRLSRRPRAGAGELLRAAAHLQHAVVCAQPRGAGARESLALTREADCALLTRAPRREGGLHYGSETARTLSRTMGYTDLMQLPDSLRALVQAELQSAESVTWLEQPIPGRAARATWPVVLFSVPWTAFAVFWMVGAAWGTSRAHETGPFRVFPLFGLPFVAIGLGLFTSPFWARRSARRTVYLLTDRRAIVLCGGWGDTVNVRSFEPAALTDLRRSQHADGSGDLVFTQDVQLGRRGDTRSTNVGFLAISDVKSVEERVRALAERRAAPA
jgi:hypothetical protein